MMVVMVAKHLPTQQAWVLFFKGLLVEIPFPKFSLNFKTDVRTITQFLALGAINGYN